MTGRMTKRRAAISILILAFGPFAFAACDDLNKPAAHPQSEPRRSCFSDVECPSNGKCVKGPQDIEGTCTPRTAHDEGGPGTAGASGDGGPAAPAPTITAAPGDIQI